MCTFVIFFKKFFVLNCLIDYFSVITYTFVYKVVYFTIFRISTVYKLSGTGLFSTIYPPNYKQNYRLQEWWFDWHYTFIIFQSKEYMTICFLAENTFTLCQTFVKKLRLHFLDIVKVPRQMQNESLVSIEWFCGIIIFAVLLCDKGIIVFVP